MSFTRTKSGVSNLNLFYDSEFIVFTEGGSESFSYENVLQGKYNKYSVDIKFWSMILTNHGFKKKVQFRALGSKTSSEKICELIMAKEIKNVIVARDSDLDDFFGKKHDSPYILYTKGYSWENDVYCLRTVKEQIQTFILSDTIPTDIESIIYESYDNFIKYAKILLKFEIAFRKKGVKFITDCNGQRFISKKGTPRINWEQIKNAIHEKKKLLTAPLTFVDFSSKEVCPFKYSYGKLLESLAISIVSYTCGKRIGMKSLPKDILVASMIDRYGQQIQISNDGYYKKLVDNLSAT